LDQPVKKVVIVGGGTAGWLTAGLLAADHCAHRPDGLEVTLIESPRIGILGVGEGTWPSLRDTLRRIGLRETDFLRRCNAAFKQGSRFDGWYDGQEGDSYFHPFEAPPNADEVDAHALWNRVGEGASFADVVSHQAALCRANRAPKQAGTPEFAAVANYAYHLDASAFADLLKEHCTEHLGVKHIADDVLGGTTDADGYLASVQCEAAGDIEGDFFIDCSGMKGLLVDGIFDSQLTDVSNVLFNDRALALHVPYRDEEEPIASQTTATALEAGWVWDIGLQTRRGVGHVFSSRHASEPAARAAFGGYLASTARGTDVRVDDARLIEFRSAYRSKPWVKNVAAVGMSSGFVEPLEASAIVMIELAATMISDTLPSVRGMMEPAAERFNARVAYRWERIVDFLKLHYILSKRTEGYWQDHRDEATWSPRLRDLMQRWRYEPPTREDFVQTQEIFPAASYAYVLYGMGFETTSSGRVRRSQEEARLVRTKQDIAIKAQRFLDGLPGHRELLRHTQTHALSRV